MTEGVITESGLYDLTHDEYHGDPCETIALTSGWCHMLTTSSPAHVWAAHPKLGNLVQRKDTKAFDLGTAAHALFLEGDDRITVIDADDWSTKAAKEARDAARADGRIPMLARQAESVLTMVAAAHKFFASTELAGVKAHTEVSLVARYEDTFLRARPDWLSDDRLTILDYKSTAGTCSPSAFARRTLFSNGYDIQAAFYRMVNAMSGGPENARFLWMVQETDAPYLCSLVGASPSVMAVGAAKVDAAVVTWRECMRSGIWPAYGPKIAWADAPPWEIAAAEEASTRASEEVQGAE